MRLFAFGLGYSARRIVRLPGIEASGTVRSAGSAQALRAEGVEAFVFDGVHGDAGRAAVLARAEVILISAPPEPSGDPVHRAFACEIAAARDLRRILYLSTIGVYGDWGGAWNVADEEPAPPQDVIAFAASLLGIEPPPEEPFDGAVISEMSRSFASALRPGP